jgi:ribosomal protein S18 acetylase RimI-like enzyme
VLFAEMRSHLKIQPCRQNDFKAVFQLLRQLWPDKPLDIAALQKVFKRALKSDSQIYLCAIDGEDVVGFASLTIKTNLWQATNLGHIDELIVDKKHRGSGLGTQLLHEIIAHARRRGCTRVELDSAFHRKKAHKFYERNGFEDRAYLFSKRLD